MYILWSVHMKRRVIQIGNSTQLISLPRKWAQQRGIKKGDELDIEEKGAALIVSTGATGASTSITLNIDKMDVSSILHCVQGAYKSGYDEIILQFAAQEVMDYKLGKKVHTLEAIRAVIPRLIGAEIISQKTSSVVIRDISHTSVQEFENVLRRIFLLVTDMSRDILNVELSPATVSTIQDQHNTVTKFVSFCLRLLNKRGSADGRKDSALFHTIASLDKITDVLKYTARDITALEKKPSPLMYQLLQKIYKSLHLYYDLYYKYQSSTVIELSKNRREVQNALAQTLSKVSPQEAHIISRNTTILDLLLDLTEWRMVMEH